MHILKIHNNTRLIIKLLVLLDFPWKHTLLASTLKTNCILVPPKRRLHMQWQLFKVSLFCSNFNPVSLCFGPKHNASKSFAFCFHRQLHSKKNKTQQQKSNLWKHVPDSYSSRAHWMKIFRFSSSNRRVLAKPLCLQEAAKQFGVLSWQKIWLN